MKNPNPALLVDRPNRKDRRTREIGDREQLVRLLAARLTQPLPPGEDTPETRLSPGVIESTLAYFGELAEKMRAERLAKETPVTPETPEIPR